MDNHGNRISEQVQSSTARGNDHDPLCLMFCDECDECDDAYCCLDCDGYGCECWMIRRVRADEREQAAQRLEALCAHTKYVGCQPCAHDEAAAAVRREAGEHPQRRNAGDSPHDKVVTTSASADIPPHDGERRHGSLGWA